MKCVLLIDAPVMSVMVWTCVIGTSASISATAALNAGTTRLVLRTGAFQETPQERGALTGRSPQVSLCWGGGTGFVSR